MNQRSLEADVRPLRLRLLIHHHLTFRFPMIPDSPQPFLHLFHTYDCTAL